MAMPLLDRLGVARRKAPNFSINWGVPMAVYIGARRAPESGDFGGQGGTPALRHSPQVVT
jgi:hypothetical protein